MKKTLNKLYQENRGLLLFLALMLVFRSAVADWNDVPTGSMKPTILEGDRILVNKMAYDLRVPFTHLSLHKFADPARGDIIIFDSAKMNERLVKRVVGVPGDRLEMQDNVLFINGQRLDYVALPEQGDYQEDLLGIRHAVRIRQAGSQLDSFDAVTVPPGQYLALGDNRDNSADSRVIGFVPRNEIVGRSRQVVLSLNPEHYYLPRAERFLKAI